MSHWDTARTETATLTGSIPSLYASVTPFWRPSYGVRLSFAKRGDSHGILAGPALFHSEISFPSPVRRADWKESRRAVSLRTRGVGAQ